MVGVWKTFCTVSGQATMVRREKKTRGLPREYSLEIHYFCKFFSQKKFRETLIIYFLNLWGNCAPISSLQASLGHFFLTNNDFLWHHMQYWHWIRLINDEPPSSHLGYMCWWLSNLPQIRLSLQNWPSPSSSCSPVSWKICWMHP